MIMMKRICLSKRAIALILALTLLFSSSLSLTSCIFSGNTISEEQYTSLANDLSERVDAGCDRKYSYVADYLNYWGFPAFSKFKIMTIESTYVTYLLDDLGYSDPDRLLALATKAARYYIDNILLTPDGATAFTLDEIRDKRIQTDAIATAYVKSVGDKYSNYLNVEMFAALSDSLAGSFAGIGVSVDIDEEAKTITVADIVAGSAAESAGILPGDMLIKVDGKSLEDYDVETFMNFIGGRVGTKVTVTVLRGGEELVFTMKRIPLEVASVGYVILEGGIAYVAIASFNDNTDEQFIDVINQIEETGAVRGYIFDVRSNTGGYVNAAINVISHILPRGEKIVEEVTKTSSTWSYSNSDHVIDLPMVVLCNEMTASAGELFTAAIRDYRNDGLLNARIIGVNTYTKGKMQNIIPLGDGSAIILTTGKFNPPCGINFDGVGIAPDIVIPFDADGETDNQMDAAIAEITSMINSK